MTRRALALAALALAACEVPFDPVDDTGRAFSMSGYLDTEADTNWVRIERLGTTVDVAPGPIDAEVVLAGPFGSTQLTQVVRRFQTGPVHLFWTVVPVEPGATYTLTATRPDGVASRATVATPAPTDPPTLRDGPTQCPTILTYRGDGRVGDAFVTYRLAEATPRTVRFDRFPALVPTGDGVQATAYYGSDALALGRDPFDVLDPVIDAEIALAVVTDDWPERTELETALVPGRYDRVENGVGFVGGATVFRRAFQPGVLVAPFSPARPCLEAGR